MKGQKGRGEMYLLTALLHPRSAATEAYRTLRTNIEFASFDAPVRTLLVTSPGQAEGKTVTASNLAVVFAQAGRQVLLVDADLRKPGVHLVFGLQNAQGLTTLLRSDEVSLDAVALPTEQANLRIVTTGPLPPNPADLLGSERMRATVERLKAAAELVIFDSSPLQTVTDARVLSSFLDGTILVIDAGHSRRGAVREAREALARAGATVFGAVLNGVPRGATPDNASSYGDYHGSEEGTKKRAVGSGTP
jgi:capsular exopolysaccharide synthesis family protein